MYIFVRKYIYFSIYAHIRTHIHILCRYFIVTWKIFDILKYKFLDFSIVCARVGILFIVELTDFWNFMRPELNSQSSPFELKKQQQGELYNGKHCKALINNKNQLFPVKLRL